MKKLNISRVLKITALLGVIVISFYLVSDNILNKKILAPNSSQLATVFNPAQNNKEREGEPEAIPCNKNEVSKDYNAFGNGLDIPYRIYNADQLRSLASNFDALHFNYSQCANIDLAGAYSATKPYFTIGSDVAHFTGTYDGNIYSISNFQYRKGGPFFKDPTNGIFDVNGHLLRNNTDYVGLFGLVRGATLKNITLVYPRVVADNNVGTLAGDSDTSKISSFTLLKSPSTSASSMSQGKFNVGGAIGAAYYSQFSDIKVVGFTLIKGENSVGGLVGQMFSSSLTKGSVLSGGVHLVSNPSFPFSDNFGGLVGALYDDSSIDYSYSNAIVNTLARDTASSAGGLIGTLSGSNTNVSKSYATGDVLGKYVVGGFVGRMDKGEIKDSYAKGNVNGTHQIGGFVGRKDGASGGISNIYRSYSTGNTRSLVFAGGFIGWLKDSSAGSIKDSYASGKVYGYTSGGFLGWSTGSTGHVIANSYSSGDVGGVVNDGIGQVRIGGFAGHVEDGSTYINNITTSNVLVTPNFQTPFYGRFVGLQDVNLPQQFSGSYYYQGTSCPPGCNNIGVSTLDVNKFYGSSLNLPPFNWVFDSNTWKAVVGALPILPNAGF